MILHSILDSILAALLPLYFLTNFDIYTGTLNALQEAGALCFTIVIVLCNIKVRMLSCILFVVLTLCVLFSCFNSRPTGTGSTISLPWSLLAPGLLLPMPSLK